MQRAYPGWFKRVSSVLNSSGMSATAATKPLAIALAATIAAVVPAAQKGTPAPRTTYVTLDAVVLDDRGEAVHGLHANDFEVREDGSIVTLDHVTEVSAAGLADDPVSRSLVLLLDDTMIGPAATTVVQGISRMLLSHVRPDDAVGVVRLTHRTDDAVGPIELAADRIAEYRARTLPFFGIESIQNLLDTVTRISKAVAANPPRRTAVVCIGNRVLCDVYLPLPENTLATRQWHNAIVESARANVAVYFVDPSGLRARRFDLGGGLADQTGGEIFAESNSFRRVAESIWDQAGHYYLLGYAPTSRPRDLHTIDVKVKRTHTDVRARRARGD